MPSCRCCRRQSSNSLARHICGSVESPSFPKMVPYQHLFSIFYYTIILFLLQLLLYQLCGFSDGHLYPTFAIGSNWSDVIQGLHLQGLPLFHGVIIHCIRPTTCQIDWNLPFCRFGCKHLKACICANRSGMIAGIKIA